MEQIVTPSSGLPSMATYSPHLPYLASALGALPAADVLIGSVAQCGVTVLRVK